MEVGEIWVPNHFCFAVYLVNIKSFHYHNIYPLTHYGTFFELQVDNKYDKKSAIKFCLKANFSGIVRLKQINKTDKTDSTLFSLRKLVSSIRLAKSFVTYCYVISVPDERGQVDSFDNLRNWQTIMSVSSTLFNAWKT